MEVGQLYLLVQVVEAPMGRKALQEAKAVAAIQARQVTMDLMGQRDLIGYTYNNPTHALL